MIKETLTFGDTKVEIAIIDNIIFIKVIGAYTDEIAFQMIRYIDNFVNSIQSYPIRVWDAGGIPSGSFNLTRQGINKISEWSKALVRKKPGAKAYMISPTPISYGMSRMYESAAEEESDQVVVLKSIDNLPEEIKSKLFE